MDYCSALKCLDTPSISDALDSMGINGGLKGIILRSNTKICGRAFTVKYGDVSQEESIIGKASDFIDEVSEGEIIVLGNNGRDDCTIWGGILTNMALIKKVGGTVIDGACRDLEEIQNLNYPLFSRFVYMKSGKGRTKKIAIQTEVKIGDVIILPGDYIFGDKNGVIVIPKEKVNEVILRAGFIQNTEEKIRNAIKNGIRLDEARKIFRYHRPWEQEEE